MLMNIQVRAVITAQPETDETAVTVVYYRPVNHHHVRAAQRRLEDVGDVQQCLDIVRRDRPRYVNAMHGLIREPGRRALVKHLLIVFAQRLAHVVVHHEVRVDEERAVVHKLTAEEPGPGPLQHHALPSEQQVKQRDEHERCPGS